MKKTKVVYAGVSEESINSKIKELESDGWEIKDIKCSDFETSHIIIAHKKEKKVDDILTLKGKAVEIWEFCKDEMDNGDCLEGMCPMECCCYNSQIQHLEFDYSDAGDIQLIERAYGYMKISQEEE